MGTETKSEEETHKCVWNNTPLSLENRENNHYINCNHPDFQSSHHVNVKPTVRILHQGLQIPEKKESMGESGEMQKEDRFDPLVNGENSGYLEQYTIFSCNYAFILPTM